jgi:thiol-disulfide isomerase/thioredoxin
MRNARTRLLITFLMLTLGCKRDSEPQARGSASTSPPVTPSAATPASPAAPGSAAPQDPGASKQGLIWYRAVVRAADGVEIPFLLGISPPGGKGEAVFRAGEHEVRAEATFDGKTLRVPIDVHQTAVEATVGEGGSLAGTFTTSWKAWGASSSPLVATKIDVPAGSAPPVGALATVPEGKSSAALDLKEPRSIWRIAMADSGTAKLVIDQTAPGDFAGVLFLDTGNIVYLAGNGRGDALVLTGFDGTSSYRLELALGADRAKGRGKWLAGHKLDWREALTATRGADFALAVKPRPAKAGSKIVLPDRPELAALPRGPLVVELAGSWCSTCRNAAPFLAELYREYKPRGLEMVTLLYELTGDPAVDTKQAEAFKQAYGVTWPVVPIHGGVEDFAEILPRGLAGVDPSGFPLTLFLGADRSLVALHAGFPAADAAQSEQRRVAAEFRKHIEALLTKSAQPAK